ncbi:MAG: NADH-quinone oxidoreductase subunit C, partial [Thiotrichaceae bacterium]
MEQLLTHISEKLDDKLVDSKIEYGELTIEVKAVHLMETAFFLINDNKTAFDELVDVCGVDYLAFGQAEWETDGSGF